MGENSGIHCEICRINIKNGHNRYECLKKSTPWFTSEIKEHAHEKRKAYLKYISKPFIEKRRVYREVRNRVKSRIREIKKCH